METPVLHFICGHVASGKTTLAREIASREQAVLICEDEWLLKISDGQINSLQDYVKYRDRLRKIFSSHVPELLRLGNSVVFDFGGNRPEDRNWVRSISTAGEADCLLHRLFMDENICRERLKLRNETKPEGLYWGHVEETLFDEVLKYFVPPSAEECFRVVEYRS
jgi:predicted kinase